MDIEQRTARSRDLFRLVYHRMIQKACPRLIRSAQEERDLVEAGHELSEHISQCHAGLLRQHERIAELEDELAERNFRATE